MGTRALVTGANGFVGRAICASWLASGGSVRASVRVGSPLIIPGIEVVDDALAGSAKCNNIDIVIHCAARAHVLREHSPDPLTEYRRINRDATIELARAAAAAGVRCFIFMSSIGVIGNRSEGKPLTESDDPHPQEDYAVSKWEAEQGLQRVASETGLTVLSLRMPLIYGRNP